MWHRDGIRHQRNESKIQVIAELVKVLEGRGMVPEQLEPRLELLREEYVLVQAWKKTASYIRVRVACGLRT